MGQRRGEILHREPQRVDVRGRRLVLCCHVLGCAGESACERLERAEGDALIGLETAANLHDGAAALGKGRR